MRVFTCQACGQLLYFENFRCERCGHALGYLPDRSEISAIEPADSVWLALATRRRHYQFCANQQFGVCNWMLPEKASETLCGACRHNGTIPDLSVPGNLERWAKLEAAKHRLFYTLIKLDLPLSNRADDPKHGLVFDFLGSDSQTHGQQVMTGHADGRITLAISEADDAERERVRTAMREPYRTLLGHFRHESGHHFWDVLVRNSGKLEAFRALFGDERQDYAAALEKNYAQGPRADWSAHFVSTYASAHPWEDFAETWAHYLHIVDTLESARAFGIKVQPRAGLKRELKASIDFDPHESVAIDELIGAWLPLIFAVNSLNRSMGQPDLYPFILSETAIRKLGFVQTLVHPQEMAGNNKGGQDDEER